MKKLFVFFCFIALSLFILFFTPFVFMGSLDRYQSQQTKMARLYLSEQIGVEAEEIVSEGGETGPFLYDSFSIQFSVGKERYTVVHENTLLRTRLGQKGQMRIIHQ